MDRLHEALLKLGAAVVIPPRAFPEYTPRGYYAMFFKDPDGIKYKIVTDQTCDDLCLAALDSPATDAGRFAFEGL